MNILLLEPYTGMRVMVRGVLKALGAKNLYEPRTSLEALYMVMNHRIDYYISSDRIKPLDALLCVKLLRAAREEDIRMLRTIIFVEDEEKTDVAALKNAGCDDCLQRPFSADDILSRVKKLKRKRPGFIETKAYVGPDRRHWQTTYKHEDRRDETFNPGRAVFKYTLQELLQKLFDRQAQRKEAQEKVKNEELEARGIYVEDHQADIRDVAMFDLEEGMVLMKPVYSTSGMLVLPAQHVLGAKSVSRLCDLAACQRVEEIAHVLVPKKAKN